MFYLVAKVNRRLLGLTGLLVDLFQLALAAPEGRIATRDLLLQERADFAGPLPSFLAPVHVSLARVLGLDRHVLRYLDTLFRRREILALCTQQLLPVSNTNLAELEVQLFQERDMRELRLVRSSAGTIEYDQGVDDR
ncbi:hypothetical protein PRNP1_012225 [Phytophthora ramorum]